jgi:branched-chain amino acid transport system permease protein
MAVGIILAGMLGAFIAIPSLRVGGDYLLVLSFGFQMVVYGVMMNWTRVTGGEGGIPGIPKPRLAGFEFASNNSFLVLTLIFAALCFLFVWWLARSPFGRALKATREDEIAIQACGKDIVSLKIWAFVLGGAVAAVGGSLFAHYMTFINPGSFTLHETVFILAIVIVGGMSNLWGTIVGAIILITLPELLRFINVPGTIVAPLRSLIYGALLVFFMLFRSQGMLPEYLASKRTKKSDNGVSGHGDLFAEGPGPEAVERNPGSETGGDFILEIKDASKSFGGLMAVYHLNLAIPRGQITALVGPNGAGKTTAFNLITGFLKPDAGSVWLRGEQISDLPPHKIARKKLGRSFQDLKLFNRLPVIDNVLAALPEQKGEKLRTLFLTPLRVKREEAENHQKAVRYLEFVGLGEKIFELPEDLSFAEKKLLSIARLLATEAEVLLLDEPASGLICIVEHNLDIIRDLADHVVFMAEGTAIADGPPEAVMSDRKLAELYFGV